ncbi:putative amidohydrolase family protein [Phaeoacremonium minimum UCRPA7]|uniref:Putative amidohydrolase family protein n=1 Tax=Phaeoacremonium minimum (strain UCR-PA7) TaxID=1286976 RepID=R8BGS2_PHAM7|nr:putative amidohydrolase family protein [Phaeoacremonium minimum UCRPA7]EON98427.1 putative amidohydrolase family protein [Phaeoacremonium minimum UCRPA7]
MALCFCGILGISRASSILLSGGTVIAFDQDTEALQVLHNTSVLIVDDRIVSLFDVQSDALAIPEGTEEIDVTGKIVSPGFVDTHRHGWETAFKTIASNTSLAEYFVRYGEYAAADKFTAEDVYIGQLAGQLEALNAGVTTILDHAHGSWSNETAQAGLDGSIDGGARVFHAFTVHELNNGWTFEDQLAKLLSVAEEGKYRNTTVSLGIAFDGWSTSPVDRVNSLIDAARQANVSVVTTHYGSGSYGNINGPEVLHSYNFLNISTPVIFSHANGLTTGEASLLRSTNQYISTTAESEAAYGVGPVTAYHIADQGALGIDTHSTFSGDMITSARFWLQSVRQVLYEQVLDKWNVPVNNPVSANQAFLMATRHGGLALHRDDLGIIAEGAKADLVVFSTDSPGLLGWVDPVAAVILHANVGDIEHVLVGGNVQDLLDSRDKAHCLCCHDEDLGFDRGEAIRVSWPKHPLVDQPSPADSQQLIVNLVKEKLFQEACMARPTTGSVFGPKSIPTDRAAINLAIVQANERLATAQTFQTHFGSVMCTSGLRTVTPFEDGPLSYLDWGLVKVDDSRLPSDAFVTNAPTANVRKVLLHAEEEYKYKDYDGNEYVYKVGRTTGVTVGRLAGTECIVRRYERFDQAGSLIDRLELNTVEKVVVCAKGFDTFADFGDSGALLRSPANVPVGLFFGGPVNEKAQKSTLEGQAQAQAQDNGKVAIYFVGRCVDLRGIYLYTPFDIVLANMHAELAKFFGEGDVKLSYLA